MFHAEAPPPAPPPVGQAPHPAGGSPSAIPASAAASGVAAVAPADAGDPRDSAREATRESARDLAEVVGPLKPGQEPSMAQVIERLHKAGIRTGLGAFNPPGTKPILVGLAVPEDFVLPPGFVRHHQTTDDGQAVEAILRYAPDFQPVDAWGRPIALPPDRVVPPEAAPPGLPLRRIVIPPPLPPARP